MIILGLVILVAAVAVGVAGVLSNSGSAHEFTGGFSVFGIDVTGSTGTLFLCGIIVGAVAVLGLGLILAGTRRTTRRHRRSTYRGGEPSRRGSAEVEQERGGRTDERDMSRTETASQARRRDEGPVDQVEHPRHKQHRFHRGAAHR